MKHAYLLLLLCLLLGRPLAGQAQTLTMYQAETGQPVAANIGSGWAGYSGSGFVGDLTTQGSSALATKVTAIIHVTGQKK